MSKLIMFIEFCKIRKLVIHLNSCSMDLGRDKPPHTLPYFTSITCLQRAAFLIPNLQSHFLSKASLKSLTFLIPKPPEEMREQTVAHLTK